MVFFLVDSQYISSTDGRKFLEEALRMRDFDHPHILTLIGIALDKDCDMPLVVLPFMRHGDLLSFIRDDINVSIIKARLVRLHYPPHFDFGYSKEKTQMAAKFSVTLYNIGH